ncbi:MAG: sulfite exporter TauE/SafE family protein, partial [Planctomycetaceae bacterium]|nr:sulfite exporter TauE/SafE family protein [Planctomycetaceae bacterium]
MQTPYFFGLIAACFFGMSKTGVPGIAMPGVLLMAHAFPGAEKLSTGAVVPLLVAADSFAVWYYGKDADWKRIYRLLPSIYVGLLAGTAALWAMNDSQFKIVLAVMVLTLIAFEETRKLLRWNAVPHSPFFVQPVGFFCGFTTLVGNAAGPVMSVYMSAQNLKKSDFMGTWAVFFFIINVSKFPLIGGCVPGLQMITKETLLFDLSVLPGVLVGVVIGRKIYKLIP